MKKILLYSLFVLVLINVSYALIAKIDIKPSFEVDEVIYFDYQFISPIDQDIVYTLQISCPNAPEGLLEQKKLSLEANKKYQDSYKSFKIDNSIEPQMCKAFVYILEPIRLVFSKNFSIDTNPSFYFEIKLCKDERCTEKSKTFVIGYNLFLEYSSEVDNPLIKSTLTLPDGSTQTLTLPTSIKAEQIGTYELEVTASKPGYKTMTKKEQFGVIEKEAEIKYASICNANGICEEEENKQNCPQDCFLERIVDKEEVEKGFFSRFNPFFIIILFAAVVILAFLVYVQLSRKKYLQK